jgi:class 3 adenylate cyclase
MAIIDDVLKLIPEHISTGWLAPVFGIALACWLFFRKQKDLEKAVSDKDGRIADLKTELQKSANDKSEQIAALQSALEQQRKSNELLHKRMLDVQQFKEQLDSLLADARSQIHAVADSILVRNPYVDGAMVFLIAHGPAAHRVVKMQVDLHASQAGSVLLSRQTSIFSPQTANKAHEKRMDTKSGFQSSNILTKPLLKFGSEAVGVVQFLNENPDAPFTPADEERIEQICVKLALTVSAITSDPTNLVHLGIVLDPHISQAAILFTDITNSDLLFQQLAVADATALVDEYLGRLGALGVRHGARIDKYLGDGMMLSFETAATDNTRQALLAALAMQQEFRIIQQEWLRLYPALQSLGHRIGIASGPVYGRRMGYGQSSAFTIMGLPVNLAAHLCDQARSAPEGILLSETASQKLQHNLPSGWALRPLALARLQASEVYRTTPSA